MQLTTVKNKHIEINRMVLGLKLFEIEVGYSSESLFNVFNMSR